MYYIKTSPEMGRGVYAKEAMFAGTVIETAELLVLSKEDTEIVNTTELKHYTFKFDETRDCLVMGCGELFNHSDTPNTAYKLQEIDGRMMMLFILVRCVEAGEQLFTDYSQDVTVNTDEYVKSTSLIE